SGRRAQEQQLRETSDQLRLMFEYAPTPILLSDPNGHVVGGNRSCLALLGYSAEALAQLRQIDTVHPEDRAGVLEDFQSLRDGADRRQREVRLLDADGHALYSLLYTGCARDASNEPLLFITEMIDRTAIHDAMREADALRERLAHAGRLGTLGEMVSGIAHEVNQPLTAIANYASAARRNTLNQQVNAAELVSILDKISSQAERAGQVIRGLRALTRRREAVREPSEVGALVRDVSRLIEFELRGAGQRLVLDLAPDLPRVRCDAVQIQQVVLNLIRNALEAMREGQCGDEVKVATRLSTDGFLEISVLDDGPGVASQIEARLFEPFVTTKKQGMGLGLSICSSIVSAHGGQLIHRHPPTGGAEFVVRLPLLGADES
ncbi:MAG TPA: ATP-binding protein, partial [Nevskiaceae bacterium]|nr:ATP-binding protein [Nevskiaceae bacterium]